MSRPINEQTWHRLPTSSSVRVHLMDWPDKGGRPPVPRRYAAAGSYGRPLWPPYPAEYLGRY